MPLITSIFASPPDSPCGVQATSLSFNPPFFPFLSWTADEHFDAINTVSQTTVYKIHIDVCNVYTRPTEISVHAEFSHCPQN